MSQNITQYPLPHVTYAPTKLEVAMSRGWGGETYIRKCIIWPLALALGSRWHKAYPVPCTLCDLHTWKNYFGNVLWFRRRNIYKDTWLDLWPWPCHMEHCPVPFCIIWHMHLQILKLLRRTVYEKMYWQKIHCLTFMQNHSQYPLHHVT